MVTVVPSGLAQPAVTPIVELAQESEFVRAWLEARHISWIYVHAPFPEGRDVNINALLAHLVIRESERGKIDERSQRTDVSHLMVLEVELGQIDE